MFTKKIAVVMALAYAAAAQDDCQNTYNSCVAAGTPEIVCNCNLTACLGEDNARNREFCATATAGLATQTTAAPSSTSNGIPGGCNPAHPGSCPTSTTAVNSIPGGCNPAHPGSCPTSTAVVNSIPGGCNPAHPGSCPSSYFTAKTFTTVYVTPTASSVAAPTPTASTPESGAGWTVENLSRYCGESDTGCDYNFKINKNDGSPSTACTIIRLGVSNASTESWYDLPCSSDAQGIRVSWGYATNPAPPFAVMTIVNQPLKKMAYFGVSNVNEQPVTASNPKGSGTYGNIGPQPLYAF